LGIKEHLRSSSRGSSARLFPTPAMVEVDLRSSSGEALKQLGYPFEDAAEVRSFTANRRAQVRGPAGPRPPRHTRYELQSFNVINQMSASVVRSEK